MQPLRNNRFFGYACIISKCSFFIATKSNVEIRSFSLSTNSFDMVVDHYDPVSAIIDKYKYNLYLIPTSKLLTTKISRDNSLWLTGLDGRRDGAIEGRYYTDLSGSSAALLYVIDKQNLTGGDIYSSQETKLFDDLPISNLDFGDPMEASFDYNESPYKYFSVTFKDGMWEEIWKLESAGINNPRIVFTYELGSYITAKDNKYKILIDFMDRVPCYAENRTQKKTCNNHHLSWNKLLIANAEKRLIKLTENNEKDNVALHIIINNFKEDLKVIKELHIESIFLYELHLNKLNSLYEKLKYR